MAAKRDFRDKVVVITGGAGGLGAAFARAFGSVGAKLVLLDLRAEALKETAGQLKELGYPCLAIPCDLTDEEACRAAFAEIEAEFGRIDVLINNAGLSHRSLFAETETIVFRRIMEVNFFGSLYATQAALPNLQESRGLIIVISTVAGFAPLIGRTGYAASKHALHGLFETLRLELEGTGVEVLIACPGFTATRMEAMAMGGDGHPVTQNKVTVGRVATPESVAAEVLQAAHDSRRMIVLTGTGKLSRIISRIFPRVYEKMMARRIWPEFKG